MVFRVIKLVITEQVFYIEADSREDAIDLACYTTAPPHEIASNDDLPDDSIVCDEITDNDVPDDIETYLA